jgi:hypothetical protein
VDALVAQPELDLDDGVCRARTSARVETLARDQLRRAPPELD